MISAVLDTHAFVWYLIGDQRLSTNAQVFLSSVLQHGQLLAVPAISIVEIMYLEEKNKIPQGFVAHLLATLPLSPFVVIPLDRDVIPIAEPEFTNSCACRIPPLPALSPLVKGGEGRGEGGFESCASTNFGSAVGIIQAVLQVPRTLIKELPDRVIVGTALALGVPLITRDTAIHQSGLVQVIW
jgi:PIN domain nuclease of toxin-antitoxin system